MSSFMAEPLNLQRSPCRNNAWGIPKNRSIMVVIGDSASPFVCRIHPRSHVPLTVPVGDFDTSEARTGAPKIHQRNAIFRRRSPLQILLCSRPRHRSRLSRGDAASDPFVNLRLKPGDSSGAKWIGFRKLTGFDQPVEACAAIRHASSNLFDAKETLRHGFSRPAKRRWLGARVGRMPCCIALTQQTSALSVQDLSSKESQASGRETSNIRVFGYR